MTEERATTTPKRTASGESRSNINKKQAKSAMANCKTSDELAATLVGGPYHFLQELVRSQPFPVAQVIIDHARKMLELFNQKLQKSESLKKFDENETNTYIPGSVRKQASLVTVPSILNDNRKSDGTPIAAAKTVMDAFEEAHNAYLKAAGKACHELLKLSIKELETDIMECAFDALYDLALAETKIFNPALRQDATYTHEDIALRASLDIIGSNVHLKDNEFNFLMSDEVINADNSRDTAAAKFVACINKIWINQGDFDKAAVLQKFDADGDHSLVNNIAGKVIDPFRRTTVGVVSNRFSLVEQKRERDELAELFAKKRVDNVNQAIAMDLDSDDAPTERLLEATRAATRKEFNRMVRQREARERKKSSAAESDAQDLQRTSGGRNGKGGGKGRTRQQKKKQSDSQRGRSPSRSTARWSNKNESRTYSPEDPPSILRRGGERNQSQSSNNSNESSQRGGSRQKQRGRGGYNRGNQGGKRGRN